MNSSIAIVIPAYNEELVIARTIIQVRDFLIQKGLWEYCLLVIANNGSTDQTESIVKGLTEKDDRICQITIHTPGKGQAIKEAFSQIDAHVYCFMDADLATDLQALPRLLSEIRKGADVSIGSRFLSGSSVDRSFFRSLGSYAYSKIIALYGKCPLSDFPCGFKAFSKDVIDHVLPQVQNPGWFFDPELLLRAYHKGYLIQEIPVSWSEHGIEKARKSKLPAFKAVLSCLRELHRVKRDIQP